MTDYAIKFHYDHIGRDTATCSKSSWLAAKQGFDDWRQNLHHAPEIKKIEMIVRGKVEESYAG
jgi:hypothetical protein